MLHGAVRGMERVISEFGNDPAALRREAEEVVMGALVMSGESKLAKRWRDALTRASALEDAEALRHKKSSS